MTNSNRQNWSWKTGNGKEYLFSCSYTSLITLILTSSDLSRAICPRDGVTRTEQHDQINGSDKLLALLSKSLLKFVSSHSSLQEPV